MRRKLKELGENLRWMAINWLGWMIFCLCLGAIVLGIAGLNSQGWRERLPTILLVAPFCVLGLSLLATRVCTRRCASCGIAPTGLVWHLDQCPYCNGLFRDVRRVWDDDKTLSLSKCVAQNDEGMNALVMILAVAIRDGGNEIRFVGRKGDQGCEYPWAAVCGSWRVWVSLESGSYEMVSPPTEAASRLFLILKETYRRTEKACPNGPACFRIAVDDLSEPAELVIEESDTERVATIRLTSGHPRKGWEGAEQYFARAATRSDCDDGVPKSTTWKRLPRFLCKRLLVVGSAVGLVVAAVGIGLWALIGEDAVLIVVIGFLAVAILAGALSVRRLCTHCGTALCQWPEDALMIWCPECHSVFDPGRRSLPMDGSTLQLGKWRKSDDPNVQRLVTLLDYALDCRKEAVEFVASEESMVVHLLKGENRVPVTRYVSYGKSLGFGLLVELQRRAQEGAESGNGTFQVVGSSYRASARVVVDGVEGGRRAMLYLEYPGEQKAE